MMWVNNNRGSMGFGESIALKAVSLLLALILWITILGFKREEVRRNVKFEPLIPPGMVLTNRVPSAIQFTLSGPRVVLKDVEKKLQPIRLDLRHSREAAINVSITEDLIGELAPGVRVVGINPTNVLIRLEETVEKFIAVKPTLSGTPAEGFEIGRVIATPAKVAVAGPRSLVQSMESVGTEVFDVQDLNGSKEGVVTVEVDATQGLQLSRDKVIKVRVTTRRIQKGG